MSFMLFHGGDTPDVSFQRRFQHFGDWQTFVAGDLKHRAFAEIGFHKELTRFSFAIFFFFWSLSCGLNFFLLKTKSRKDLSCFSLVKSLGKQPKKTTWDASPHPVRSSSFIGIPWPEVERCASEGVREGSSSRFFDGVAGTTVVTIEKSMVFFQSFRVQKIEFF